MYDSRNEWRGDSLGDQSTRDGFGKGLVATETWTDDDGTIWVNLTRDNVLLARFSPYQADILAYHLNMTANAARIVDDADDHDADDRQHDEDESLALPCGFCATLSSKSHTDECYTTREARP